MRNVPSCSLFYAANMSLIEVLHLVSSFIYKSNVTIINTTFIDLCNI